MTPHDKTPLPERVAVLESEVNALKGSVKLMLEKEDRTTGLLNAISISVATLSTNVDNLIKDKAVWKNPLVWTNLISLGIALIALYKRG